MSAPLRSEIKPGRGKVALQPGHSQLDWMRKAVDPPQGPSPLTMAEVHKHNSPDDAWMVLRGKVYDITPYLPFHPGGVGELLRGAGQDGTALFEEVHRWVNAEFMLAKVCVGDLAVEAPAPPPSASDAAVADVTMPTDAWTPCVCVSIAAACEDFVLIKLALPEGMSLGWRDPLQHVDLCFTGADGEDIIRPYTPVSSLRATSSFDLLIKLYPAGAMSGFVRALGVGDSVKARPHASFVSMLPSGLRWGSRTVPAAALVLFAGGSGITPMLQLLQGAARMSPRPSVHLILSVASLAHIPLAKPLLSLLDSAGVTFHVFITGPPPPPGSSPFPFTPGRVSVEGLRPLLPAPTADTVCVWSGPVAFCAHVDTILRSLYFLATNFIALDS